MKIFGVDFTSSPSSKKPITCVSGYLDKTRGKRLVLDGLETFSNFLYFEGFLKRKGPWLTGIDLPIGLPSIFTEYLKLKRDWSSYVSTISKLDKHIFEAKIKEYKKNKSKGNKEPLRITDVLTGGKSPLKLINPPVGKMFYEGATRLIKEDVSILPCRMKKVNRIILECYPALIAKNFAKKYKDERVNKPFLIKAREEILKNIISVYISKSFGFYIEVERDLKELALSDPKGDVLDAILCAISAASGYFLDEVNYGIPCPHNTIIRSEGWIINPYFISKKNIII